MSIKPEADDIFFSKYPPQRALANSLSEAFDVTFGAKHGELYFWLAQPTSRAQERFGILKEVLVIYSEFPVTDARVLTAIENLSRKPEYKHRVDRVLALVIHSGDPTKAEDLALSDPERVIVAIAAKELTHPERGSHFLRAVLTDTLGAIDLFGMSSPIVADKYFFGRAELVQQLARRASAQNQNSGLFGLRKTGKTSVLLATGRALENQSVLFEYFDCQNPGIHNARWWDCLANIIERLKAALHRQFNKRPTLLQEYSQATAGSRFVVDLRSLIGEANLDGIVIALDEIEYITSGLSGRLGIHWDQDFLPFWQTIRSAHQELKGQFTFIVAGVNPTCIQRSHFGTTPNPIFQAAQPYYLEPLPSAAVRTMVRSLGRYCGMSFREDLYDWLQNQYGGHPYLIRLACSEIWRDHKPMSADGATEITRAHFVGLEERIRRRLAQPIKDILLSLAWWYPDEYALLQILADGDASFVSDYLSDNQASVLQFAKYGLLREGTGTFAIEDIRGFLRTHGEEYKKEISPFQRSDMPPELLPEVPDLVLLGDLFRKRCELEVRLRRVITVYLGVRFGWNAEKMTHAVLKGLHKREDRPKPESLFVGRDLRTVFADLFMLDLKEIICQNWDAFSNLFDNSKPRLEMNLDTINKARRVEGHTKPVTKREAEEFHNSYEWLLTRLRGIEDSMGFAS